MSAEVRKGEACESLQSTRFRLACAIVGMLAMVVVASSVLEAAANPSGSASSQAAVALAGFDAVMGFPVDDPFAASNDGEFDFEVELFSLRGLSDVRMNWENGLMGYSQEGDAVGVLDALEARLAANGWQSVPVESSACRSFSKGSGSCRWAFASAAQVGEATSVVVQWSDVERKDE